MDGDDGLTPQRRAAVLAAAREALRNVLKHSGVSEALVRVWDEPDGLTLVVRDFGAGFDPAAHQPGFGLAVDRRPGWPRSAGTREWARGWGAGRR